MANRVVLAWNSTYYYPENIANGDNIDMQSAAKIVNLSPGTSANDSLAFGQSGASLAGLALTAALALGGNLINNVATPVASTDAATKGYVDGLVNGAAWLAPALAVSTSNIATMSGTATVDGVSLVAGNRVLLTAQSTGSQNGLWLVQSGAWTRPSDFATGKDAASDAVWIEKGTANADTAWVCTSDTGSAVVDTGSLTFVKFTGAVGYTAGAGLLLTGSSFSVKPGDGINVTANSASVNVTLDGSAPGLKFTGSAGSGALAVLAAPTGGLAVSSAGVVITPDTVTSGSATVAVGTNGLRVLGLPATFNIAGTAVGANVTASNLSALTAGPTSNADSLHAHAQLRGQFTTVTALSAGSVVCWSTTADKLDLALSGTPAKAFGVGVALGTAAANATADVVFDGIAAGVLSGATPGAPYYLTSSGGLSATPPSAGNRLVVMGTAKNATDLLVKVRDYGGRVV